MGTSYRERIEKKITATFQPIALIINDDSNQHSGHSGADPRGETHFSIIVISSLFEGLSRVARHRLIYDCVRQEMEEHIHALSLSARTPEEHAALTAS